MGCRRSLNSSGSRWWCSRALFRVSLLLGLIWLLWVGLLLQVNQAANLSRRMLENGRSTMMNMKHEEMDETKSLPPNHHQLKNMEINFVSKRRIPNGPDPIHNRAGNSRRPPGQD